jgi:hypothetical protein
MEPDERLDRGPDWLIALQLFIDRDEERRTPRRVQPPAA